MTERREQLHAVVGMKLAGKRLDQVLPLLFPDFSRSRLQRWIKQGLVTLDGKVYRPRDKVSGGEKIDLEALLEDQVECRPQNIPLDLIYEDDQIIVVNKPVGLVVHPAPGNPDGTMQNALLYHDPELIQLPRAGIVHRLDKETSGLLVVARTIGVHRFLVEKLQAREFEREYHAIVTGVMTAGGTVDEPIGRHPVHRTRMAVVFNGKPAVTHYRALERFRAHTYVKVKLETGRTHQIRVHLAHIRYPLVGDPVYSGRLRLPAGSSEQLKDELRNFKRQALHARCLGLVHPGTGEYMEWEAPVPEDMECLLAVLRQETAVDD
ncbi:23S rRNA pseudouridine(1911/1915/1917) synthase RluD [Candidatus Vondammii sp. HM_W22]|uniref:23S rRNA pseudouridine(1911/1915/1917) synthase RluD n=1 Tax=Candidatus Vondammii sp. HM_W22 TaxID=2687299 RepID=UPI002402BD29